MTSDTSCQSKIDLLRKEILKPVNIHQMPDHWYRNITLLMAEIILSSHAMKTEE